jgi:3-hydroxyisobutyrate dehydrogenase
MSDAATVLFVGLGTMGRPMARNLARSGVRLLLSDVDTARTQELAAELSGTAAADPAAVAGEADVAILMLPNSAIVRGVLEGGLLAALPAGALVVDMSSSQPEVTTELAELAAGHGVELVDAPVSGGEARAVTGELSIMVGGAAESVERARPLLAAMGTSITATGPVGTAHAMKALNNLLSAIGLAAASEVLAIGAKFGLEPEVMLTVLNGSTGRNHATEVKMERFVLSRRFDSGFALDLMVKDLSIALSIAREAGVSAPIAGAAVQTWIGARTMLADHRADHTEVARFVERNAGVELR